VYSVSHNGQAGEKRRHLPQVQESDTIVAFMWRDIKVEDDPHVFRENLIVRMI